MPPRVLTVSTANAAFQRIDVLRRNRTKRHRYGEFVIEGVRAINGALAAGWTIRSFAYAAGRTMSRWASSILDASAAESHLEIFDDCSIRSARKDERSGCWAVVAQRPIRSIELLSARSVVVVVRSPASPGNLGTLIRSGDASRRQRRHRDGARVDLYDPSTIRASVGSFFAVRCCTPVSS
jgi:TrmH family RNA methyltransferase